MNIKNNRKENIRHLPLYLLLTTATGYILPTLVSSEAVSDDVPAAIAAVIAAGVKVVTTGHINLTADRGRKTFTEFLAGLRLTAIVRALLTSNGSELVDTHEQTDVVYELDDAFQALRPVTRCTAEVRVGDYVKNPVPLATKSGRGGFTTLSLNPLTMLISMIAPDAENTTDVQNSVNATMAGDPGGKCLPRCETWRYHQHNVINLTRKEDSTEQKCFVLATAKDAELMLA